MIALIVHNPEHRRLLQAMELAGLLNPRHDVTLLTVGTATTGARFERVIVVDAPEYEERRSAVWMQHYSDWIQGAGLGLKPGQLIDYLHPAGKPE